ncbi:lactonase family protein [Paenibacillus alkalitolerans]|uniref:lactonase family protein n=1 Tax=Paenibacillus alkalitolerans TaxID=2799335 RepID=UPI0018F33A4C|nr:lactonase family protein [Paenibacillus alkalitolerans]
MGSQRVTDYRFYVGTYASSHDEGIHYMSLNRESGRLSKLNAVSGIDNPSYLTLDLARKMLYAVSETESGQVYAYDAADTGTGQLTFRNKRATAGSSPCHVLLSGDLLLIANYMGGVSVFPVADDGGIGEMSEHLRYEGTGLRKDRQEGSHPHSVFASVDGRYFYVSDLGLDTIFIYSADRENGRLIPQGECRLTAGAGPRHMSFHPHKPYAYCINELDSTITAFHYHAETGGLKHIDTISTLPERFHENNTTADIHLSPCGNFLYGSNRGHDSIAMFRIAAQTGMLSLIGHISCGGRTPRNFAVSPDGEYILVANQDSENIACFRVDPATGTLADTGERIGVNKPVCIRFAPPHNFR